MLIESAYFKPQNIRATSKKLDLRTESSYRFERGARHRHLRLGQPARRAIDSGNGRRRSLAEGVVDAYPQSARAEANHFAPCAKRTQLLGIEIPADATASILCSSLDLRTRSGTPAIRNPRSFAFPTFRVDLKREVDLIEEIARLYGVDKIPSTPPRGAIGSNPYDAVHDQMAEARRILTGLGLNEAQGQTLISDSAGKLASRPHRRAAGKSVEQRHERAASKSAARDCSMRCATMSAAKITTWRCSKSAGCFVAGWRSGKPRKEERRLAIALDRPAQSALLERRRARCKIRRLRSERSPRGILRAIRLARRELTFAAHESTALFLESAAIQLGKHDTRRTRPAVAAAAPSNTICAMPFSSRN